MQSSQHNAIAPRRGFSMRTMILFFAGLATVPLVHSQPTPAKHARVELIAERPAVAPGTDTEFLLGVHFLLDPGWHIYWVNPGDSGQPPVFKWQLPPGFTAGDVQWPRPERMQTSPQIADYGYHDEALLMVPLHVAATANRDALAQAKLDAKWLICREVCLADRAQLRPTLPLANRANERIFTKAKQSLPKPLPAGWKASVISSKENFLLSVAAPSSSGQARLARRAEFFPLDPAQVENAAPQQVTFSRGVKIVLKKSDLLLKPIAFLRGVLVLGNQAYFVTAPVIGRGTTVYNWHN